MTSPRFSHEHPPSESSWGLLEGVVALVIGYLGSAVVATIVSLAGGWRRVADTPGWALFLAQIPLWAAMAGIPILVARRRGQGPAEELGLRVSWIDVPLGAAVGAVTQLLVVPALYWPLGRWITTEQLEAPARSLADRFDGVGGALLLVLMVCVAAPIAEEILWRGLLLRAGQRRFGTGVAVAGTALLFGAMHLQMRQFPGLAMFGLVAALLVVRTGRLGTSIFAHIAFNTVTVIGLLQR